MGSETTKKSIKMPKIIILEHIESETHQKITLKLKFSTFAIKPAINHQLIQAT